MTWLTIYVKITMFNRYSQLKNNNFGKQQMPFVKINEQITDKYISWKLNRSRYDILSDTYYGSPEYGFLISYANPTYINEHDINDGDIIRIPFPLDTSLSIYNNNLKNILK